MTRIFKYPLRPTTAQEKVLLLWLGVCADLYNAALQERRDAWRISRKSVTRYDQLRELTAVRQSDPAVAAVPCEIARSALRRVDLAFSAFFRRCRQGGPAGYPRFRSRHHYASVSFPFITAVGNRLHVPRLGLVRFHRYRCFVGVPKQVTIKRELSGKWTVSIVCDLGEAPAKTPVFTATGIDLGLTSFATLSDGSEVSNPHFLRASFVQLRRAQQTLSRRQRGSASRERARNTVAKAYARIANQRLDFSRKLACTLFDRYDLIAHEDLEIARMVRGHFAKSIGDAGWGVFLQALHCKAESAGKHAIAVDPRGTTQRCSGCGTKVPKGIGDRQHVCSCGVTLGRDHNAALNVLALGRSAVETLKSGVVEAEVSL